MIFDLIHLDAGLLEDLARDGVLERFSGFDKTGNR
jgi:hypothetical protein